MCGIAAATNGVNGIKSHKEATAAAPEIIKAPRPNPTLQVTADHRLKAVEAPVYAPRAGEVLLHIKATGICG
jgi:L-iditol 2-dehydrogenase